MANERIILKKYPFLRCRKLDGSIDTTAKFPIMYLEIPKGWYRLFFQMCDDIKPILEAANALDSFYFVQVKEKYNQLRCYCRGDYPQKVDEIIAKYENLARYVCTKCGKPAAYETDNYIASFCVDCLEEGTFANKLDFKSYFVVNSFTESTHVDEKKISYQDEWLRYLQASVKENT